MLKTANYPRYVCMTCGEKYGRKPSYGSVASYCMGICGNCGAETSVTDPRDFGYPNFEVDAHEKKAQK